MTKNEEFLLKKIKDNKLDGLSLREISDLIPNSAGNAGTAQYYLEKLQKNGYIIWNRTRKKIVLLGEVVKQNIKSNVLRLPFYGYANCGEALSFADNTIERFIEVSSPILKNKTQDDLFIVQADGDSMNLQEINGKKIESGDFIIIDKSEINDLKNGDCVLSIINGMANIKIYNKSVKDDYIKLEPNSSNKNHFPIFIHEDGNFTIAGKILEIIKK